MAAGDVVVLSRWAGPVTLEGVLDADGLVCEVRVVDGPDTRYRGTITLGGVEYWLEADLPVAVTGADRFAPDDEIDVSFTGNR